MGKSVGSSSLLRSVTAGKTRAHCPNSAKIPRGCARASHRVLGGGESRSWGWVTSREGPAAGQGCAGRCWEGAWLHRIPLLGRCPGTARELYRAEETQLCPRAIAPVVPTASGDRHRGPQQDGVGSPRSHAAGMLHLLEKPL